MPNIETVPYNFDELYNALKIKFEEKGYDTAEGSNTSQLVTAMAYLTSMLNVNTSVNINENILSLATKRNNVLQDARMLGYEASKEKSYIYQLELTFDADGSYTIPQYTEFTAGDKSYYYMRSDVTVFSNRKSSKDIIDWVAGTYNLNDVIKYNNIYYEVIVASTTELPTHADWNDVTAFYITYINVKEGTLKLNTENEDILTKTIGSFVDTNGITQIEYYMDIPFQRVEDDGLEIFLTFIDVFGLMHSDELWTKSKSLSVDKDDELDRKFFRVDNIDYETPRIYFTLNGIGNILRSGTGIKVNVLLTNGIDGEINSLPKTELSNVNIASFSLVSKGTTAETITSIKENAPLLFNTAGRAITKNDYKVITERTTLVGKSEIWGGEDENPQILGQLYFSFVPEVIPRDFIAANENKQYELTSASITNNYFLTNESIRSTNIDAVTGFITDPGIFDTIDEFRPPSLHMNIRNPVYTDITADIKIIKYTSAASKEATREKVFNVINDYFYSTLENFYSEIFTSNVIKRIDTTLTDISGVELSLNFKANLTSHHLIKISDTEYNIDIYLNMPYDNAFDAFGNVIMESVIPDALDITPASFDINDNLIIAKTKPKFLPNIETENFVEAGKHLEFDISGIRYSTDKTELVIPLYINEPDGTLVASIQQIDTARIEDATVARTNGSVQIVSLSTNEHILYSTESTSTGAGTVGKIYRALNNKTAIDINNENFTDVGQWADEGFKIPSPPIYNYNTTGISVTQTVLTGETVYIGVISGSTGIGTLGNIYSANSDQVGIDLDTTDFTNVANWTNLGAKASNPVFEIQIDEFIFSYEIPDNSIEDEYKVLSGLRDLITAEHDVRCIVTLSSDGSAFIGTEITTNFDTNTGAYLILFSKEPGQAFAPTATVPLIMDNHIANQLGYSLRHWVGEYTVFNGDNKYIKVRLNVLDQEIYDTLSYTNQIAVNINYSLSSLRTTQFNSEVLMNITNISEDIRFYRNMLPRLRYVNIQ